MQIHKLQMTPFGLSEESMGTAQGTLSPPLHLGHQGPGTKHQGRKNFGQAWWVLQRGFEKLSVQREKCFFGSGKRPLADLGFPPPSWNPANQGLNRVPPKNRHGNAPKIAETADFAKIDLSDS